MRESYRALLWLTQLGSYCLCKTGSVRALTWLQTVFEAGNFVFRSVFNMESSGANAVEPVTVRTRAKSIMKAEGEVSYNVWHIPSV